MSLPGGDMPFAVRVVEAKELRELEHQKGSMSPCVVVTLGRREHRSEPVKGGGRNCTINFEAALVWSGEKVLRFSALDTGSRKGDKLIGDGELWMEDTEFRNWQGHVKLISKTGSDSGRLLVELTFRGANNSNPTLPAGTGPSGGSRPQDVVQANADAEELKRYAVRLSEVVMQQHAARREDWTEFRAREAAILGEARDLKRVATAWQEEHERRQNLEARLENELRSERRRRIDLEARLLETEQWRQDMDRVQVNHAATHELREAKRQLHDARNGEDQAWRSEQRAEDQCRRLRQEMQRSVRDSERKFAESELQVQSREAEVLGAAWQISGELRSELTACRAERVRQGLAPTPPSAAVATAGSSARQALSDLRGVRERYNHLLNELPG